jgi:hypothetical protein
MANCSNCGAATQLFICGIPLCAECDAPPHKPALGEINHRLQAARATFHAAARLRHAAEELVSDPERVDALRDATESMEIADAEYRAALSELENFGQRKSG